jgi:hypothetical protein
MTLPGSQDVDVNDPTELDVDYYVHEEQLIY